MIREMSLSEKKFKELWKDLKLGIIKYLAKVV